MEKKYLNHFSTVWHLQFHHFDIIFYMRYLGKKIYISDNQSLNFASINAHFTRSNLVLYPLIPELKKGVWKEVYLIMAVATV